MNLIIGKIYNVDGTRMRFIKFYSANVGKFQIVDDADMPLIQKRRGLMVPPDTGVRIKVLTNLNIQNELE